MWRACQPVIAWLFMRFWSLATHRAATDLRPAVSDAISCDRHGFAKVDSLACATFKYLLIKTDGGRKKLQWSTNCDMHGRST